MTTTDGASTDPLADPRVFAAVQDYQAELDAGRRPDAAAFAARYPAVAAAVADCLRGFDFLWRAAPRVTHHDTPGGRLGDFRLVREIGRGGMGVVYEAEQVSLGRRVALKVLAAPAVDERARRRFQNEAHAVAALNHPHVVPVHAVGADGDALFLAMKLVEGRSLAEVLRDRATPDPRAVARLGKQAAEALQHAHDFGIVHRDVKPGNLLLEPSGHLWVADFGLARLPGADDLTRTGEVVGTLRYLSPEQAAGAAVDHRTDVYSLGVTLYELATGRPAFPGADARDLLKRVAESEPPAPRAASAAVPRDLETVVLKAMAKEPAERYATAADLAADLGRFLDDRPVLAARPTTLDRARKWVRRHRTAVRAAAAAAFVLLAVVAGGVALVAERVAGEKKIADKLNVDLTAAVERIGEQKRDVDALNVSLRAAADRRDSALGAANFQLARRDWTAGDFARAAARLDQCRPDLRPWEWHYLDGLCRDVAALPDLGGTVMALAFDPSSDRLVAAPRTNLPPQRGSLKCFTVAPNAPAAAAWSVPSSHRGVTQLLFDPHGRWVAAAENIQTDHVGGVTMLDPATGREMFALPLPGAVQTLVGRATDGECVAAVAKENELEIWDVARRRVRTRFPLPPGGDHHGGCWGPDGTRLALPGRDQTRVVDTETGRVLVALPTGPVNATAFSPDGRRLAVSGVAGIRVWDLAAAKEVAAHVGHPGVTRLVFSPDGERLVSAGQDGFVRVWGAAGELAAFRGHGGKVLSLGFAADGVRVAAGGQDGTVRVFNTLDPSEGRAYPGFGQFAVRALSADGALAAVRAGGTSPYQLVEVTTGRSRGFLAEAGDGTAAFRPDGKRVAVAGRDGTLRVFDATTGAAVANWPIGTEKTWALAYSPDGGRLVAVAPTAMRVFDAAGGRLVREQPGLYQSGEANGFRPDGRLAVGQREGTVQFWSADAETPGDRLTGHDRPVAAVAASVDGKLLASGDQGGAVRVWDAGTHQLIRALPGNGAAVKSLAFSPDGTRLAAAVGDGTVRLHDTAGWEEVLTIRLRSAPTLLRFDARGEVLTAVTLDGPVRFRAGAQPADWTGVPAHRAAWHRESARAAEKGREWVRATWHLTRLADLTPDEVPAARLARAEMAAAVAFGEVGDWANARHYSAFAVTAGFDVTDLEANGWAPVWLRVYLGDAAERRRLGTALVKRHAAATNPRALQLAARMAVLVPDGVDDPSAAVAVAARAADLNAGNPYLWQTLALAHLRAADPDAALAAVRRAVAARPDIETAWETELIVALSEARRGESAAARRRLERVGAAIDRAAPVGLGGALGREEVARLRAEVAALVRGGEK